MIKIFEWITELIGWLQIAASPFFIGLIIGAAVYFPNETIPALIIGLCITSIGLLVGIALATKIYKSKNGTMWFLSGTMATPDLDEKYDRA